MKRMSAALLALALLLSSEPLAARADDAASLLAKHRTFVGWQFGDGSLTTLRASGHAFKDDGTTVSTFVEKRAGVGWRRDTHGVKAGTDSSAGFTGRIFWATNENGFIRPELGDLQKYNIARDLLFNEATSAMPGTSRGTKDVAGKTYAIVRVSPAVAFPIDLYIDPATGAYGQAVIDPDGTYETTVNIDAYAEAIPGKKIISKWRYDDGKAGSTYDQITGNSPVTNDDLHPPGQTAQWSFANGKSFPIYFRDNDPEHDHSIELDAVVNGVKGHFVMDTGASGFFFTQGFATRAKLKRIDSSMASGIGGDLKTEVDRADTMAFGDNVLSNVVVTAGKVDFGGQIDGLIGFDLFAGAVVAVDLDKQTMTLYDPKAFQAQQQGFVLTVDLSEQVPQIPMKINGSTDVIALLDSGNAGDVDISNQLTSRYGVRMLVDNSPAGYLKSHKGFVGVGGVEVDDCGRLDSIAVGPISYTDAPACKSPSFQGRQVLVGFDFIKNFNLIFNYPQAQLILIPRKQ